MNGPPPESVTQPLDTSIANRFATVAARHPNRVAVETPEVRWTYEELAARSTVVAQTLLDHGTGPGVVALLMAHGAPLIAAIVGVLKAGRIYLVLDSAEPVPALRSAIAEFGIQTVLADDEHLPLARSLTSDSQHVIQADCISAGASASAPLPDVPVDAGAWLMQTSGSTGKRKAVWQNHCGVVHHADVYARLIRLTPQDRLSLLTPCNLAASATAVFAALLNGAALCPFHVRTHGVERLAEWLRDQRISVYHSVPTVFRHLVRAVHDGQSLGDIRLVRLGGEPVFRTDADAFRKRFPADAQLMNALSSTETGLISALMLGRETPFDGTRMPVGPPVSGVDVVLLDEEGNAVARGCAGRLAVRSAHLAQGYWGRPEDTSAAFREDPTDPERRVFVTGDLARILPDGLMEHLGRVDQQVKIRGRRVDLTEVEAALESTGLFQEAAAAAPEDASGERRLVAYVVPRDPSTHPLQACRSALQSHLPEHLIPGQVIALNALPRTGGGKIDRRALPVPERESGAVRPTAAIPRGGIENNLTRIWQGVLDCGPIGPEDDFFELGGTSIHSAQILSRIEERFGVALPPSILAEHGTIAKLAEEIGARAVRPASGPLVTLQAANTGRPLFLVHSAQGDVAGYGQLARRLRKRPMFAFQSVGLDGRRLPLMTIDAMARRYLRELLAKDPSGPYLLGGTCMGAQVAFQMARRLVHTGRTVALLALIDYNPRPPRSLAVRRVRRFTDAVRNAGRTLRWVAGHWLRLGKASGSLRGAQQFVARVNRGAARNHVAGYFPGTITLFVTAETQYQTGDRRLALRRCATECNVITIPGVREELFIPPAVAELASQLDTVIASLHLD